MNFNQFYQCIGPLKSLLLLVVLIQKFVCRMKYLQLKEMKEKGAGDIQQGQEQP
jgi:hypothetical protein